MDWYHLVLLIHILGVLGLFMALAVELVSMVGARSARTIETVRVWSSTSKSLEAIFPLSALVILGAGLAMTIGAWGWGQAWIDLSLGLVVLLSILGGAINSRYTKRIAARAAELGRGSIPADFRHELNHPIHWTSLLSMSVIALAIVFLMVLKPDWLVSALITAISLIVGVILAQALVRSGNSLASAQTEEPAEEQPAGVSTKA